MNPLRRSLLKFFPALFGFQIAPPKTAPLCVCGHEVFLPLTLAKHGVSDVWAEACARCGTLRVQPDLLGSLKRERGLSE